MIITFNQLENYGRLANQLFESASIIGLAKRYKAKSLLPPNWSYRKHCSLPDEFYGVAKPDVEVQEKVFEYTDNLLEPFKDKDVINVTGVLQSVKYQWGMEYQIKEWFRPKNTKYLGDNSVGVHIRRGDYINKPGYVNYEPEYYLSAILKYFNDLKYKFYICSDDTEYCKLHFKGAQYIFPEGTPEDDLAILAGCKHHIMCNSSFSWWGTFLATQGGINIRPPKIFSGRMANFNESTFWIDEWIEHSDFKTDLTDVTFIIPVSYDHKDRRENLQITTDFLSKSFKTNIIVGEQGTKRFKNIQYKYIQFPYNVFHRTKMLNRMTELATTPIIVNWDADVLFSPFQVYKMVEMLRGEYDFVYPYDGRFLRVGDGTYTRKPELIELLKNGDIGMVVGQKFVGEDDQSVGGAVGYKKSSFIEAGMENENFIAYTPEDVERKYRFETLDYKVGRVDGALYHLNHYCSESSLPSNPFHKDGMEELNKVRSMPKPKLQNYIKTWSWLDNRKVVLVCYADEKFKPYQDRLVSIATQLGAFDYVFVYDRNWLEGTDYYKKNKKILNETIGGGCCAWKPAVILDAMFKLKDGDTILYMDSADIFKGDIRKFLLENTHDVILTNGAFKNSDWTKMDCFVEMVCDSMEYYDAIQLEAGVGVYKKSKYTLKLLNEWLWWCQNYVAISTERPYTYPNLEGYKEHRYDQSILTNLKIKNNIYSSGEIREYITCNVGLHTINDNVTYLIPVVFDGKDRVSNLVTVIRYLRSISDANIVVMEQMQKSLNGYGRFEFLAGQVDYRQFNDINFHRTKMLNDMVKSVAEGVVCVCDADVIVPQDQIDEAIRLIVDGEADVVYPYTEFVKLTKEESEKIKHNLGYVSHIIGIESKGGMIFFNKESYLGAGGENENFISWGLEDIELYDRLNKLGYIVERIPGKLFHLHHYVGVNSSKFHPYYNNNVSEYKKVTNMNKDQIIEYVNSWKTY